MVTVLLIVIYITFVGLGIPDSALGSAWPVIYPDLGLPVGYASFITALISLFTATASFFSARLINKFGTGIVTAASTLLTALALLGFALSDSMLWLCVFAIPTGFGAGAIDAALNNYVAVHYNASQMSFLHCAYGVGVALSPFVLSFALQNSDWRLGYRTIFYIQLGIAAITFLALPLWKKVKSAEPEKENFTPRTLSYKEMAKIPAERAAWLAFFATCSLEFTCDHWCCTYLVDFEGAPADVAARFLTLYYIGMAGGRFLSGLLAKKLSSRNIIRIGYCFVAAGIATLFLPVPYTVKGFALFAIGLGNGPTFPNLTYLTPINFGKEISQSLVSSQMLMCNIGIMIMPALFGALAQRLSLKAFPYFAAALYAVMVLFTALYFSRVKKMKTAQADNNNQTPAKGEEQ